MGVMDLPAARWRIGNRQGAVLPLTVGDLDLLIILGVPQILESLFYVALRAGYAHERCCESRGSAGLRIVCERKHDGR